MFPHVMSFIIDNYALVCLEYIPSKLEKEMYIAGLKPKRKRRDVYPWLSYKKYCVARTISTVQSNGECGREVKKRVRRMECVEKNVSE